MIIAITKYHYRYHYGRRGVDIFLLDAAKESRREAREACDVTLVASTCSAVLALGLPA